jgi:hypothetical protein
MSNQLHDYNMFFKQVIGDFTDKKKLEKSSRDPQVSYSDEYQSSVDIIISTEGIHALTLVCELLDENNNEKAFENQHYKIYVSHIAGDDFQEKTQYDFYHTQVLDPNKNWILLRTIPLGNDVRQTNSWTDQNQSIYANILHFKYIKFSIDDPNNNSKIRLTVSGR